VRFSQLPNISVGLITKWYHLNIDLSQTSSLNSVTTFVQHLSESLNVYLNISAQTTELLANQSASVKGISTHMSTLSDMINDNFRGLESGFERIGHMLDHAEERLSLWSQDYRTWMVAAVGFVVGAASRLLSPWILTGTTLLIGAEIGIVGVTILLHFQTPLVYGIPLVVFACLRVAACVSIYYFRGKRSLHHTYNLDFLEDVPRQNRLDNQTSHNRGYVRADGRYSMLYL
jgi:hypothetical protein